MKKDSFGSHYVNSFKADIVMKLLQFASLVPFEFSYQAPNKTQRLHRRDLKR